MKKLIFLIVIFAFVAIAAIKYVPIVNDIAREQLPEEVLRLLGEKPKNIFERGLDKMKDAIDSIGN